MVSKGIERVVIHISNAVDGGYGNGRGGDSSGVNGRSGMGGG